MTVQVLTNLEKERVRHHCGYPNVGAAATIQFGMVKPGQFAFLLELAMDLLRPESVQRVRDYVQELDRIDKEISAARCILAADKVGSIQVAGSQDAKSRLYTDRLELEYYRWACRLADVFGVPLYPFSQRFRPFMTQYAGAIPVRS